jgi:hypothetical protein
MLEIDQCVINVWISIDRLSGTRLERTVDYLLSSSTVVSTVQ